MARLIVVIPTKIECRRFGASWRTRNDVPAELLEQSRESRVEHLHARHFSLARLSTFAFALLILRYEARSSYKLISSAAFPQTSAAFPPTPHLANTCLTLLSISFVPKNAGRL